MTEKHRLTAVCHKLLRSAIIPKDDTQLSRTRTQYLVLNPKDRKQRSTKILRKEDKQKIKAKNSRRMGMGGREEREEGREREI